MTTKKPIQESDWKKIAIEAIDALKTFNAFYDDLAGSNPGFMGGMCLQDYAQWNQALLKSEVVLRKYAHPGEDGEAAGLRRMEKC